MNFITDISSNILQSEMNLVKVSTVIFIGHAFLSKNLKRMSTVKFDFKKSVML